MLWKSTLLLLISHSLPTFAVDVYPESFNPTYGTTHSSFPWPWASQYTSFFPKYNGILLNASTVTCSQTYADYAGAYAAPPSSPQGKQLLLICYAHETCILDALPSSIQANFNSATVILGLMPTLLSAIAPSVADMALLSVYRPGLSFLLAMGAPSIWPTRLFEYSDPIRSLTGAGVGGNEAARAGTLLVIRIPRRFKGLTAPLSALQYALTAGAVFNVVWTSVQLGRNTILSWGCTTTFGPLLWTSLAGVVHVVAACGFAIARRSLTPRSAEDNNDTDDPQRASRRGSTLATKAMALLHSLATLFQQETTLCAEQTLASDMSSKDETPVPLLAVVTNILAGCGAFIHLMFGIIIFSSLQLVSVWDVLNAVLCRYVASAAVCRLILLFEMGGLRGALSSPSSGGGKD